MMKNRFKLITHGAALGAILANATVSYAAWADVESGGPPPPLKGFCTTLAQAETKSAASVNGRAVTLASAQSNAVKQLAQTRTQVDNAIAAERAKQDSARRPFFSKLETDAATPAQKQAATAFEQTVQQAETTRRAAVDQARASFRAAEDQALGAHHSQIDGAATTFKANVTVVANQAHTSCLGGADQKMVHDTFVAGLKQARSVYQTAISHVTPGRPAVESATQIRKSQDQAANNAFKEVVQQAGATLKSTLGQK